MNKNQSKYFNTAVKMDKALISLLEKKDFEYITIKEICHTAGVNRSTFYLHYENTGDLLQETTRYITDGFLEYFSVDEKNIREKYTECDLNDLVFVTPKYLTPYLTYIKNNQRVFKTTIKQFGVMNFQDVYNKMSAYIFDPVLDRFNFQKSEREYVLKFYLTGITAIVMEWLKNDCSDPIDKISNIIINCVLSNGQDIKRKE